jgi:hypothetical protein
LNIFLAEVAGFFHECISTKLQAPNFKQVPNLNDQNFLKSVIPIALQLKEFEI